MMASMEDGKGNDDDGGGGDLGATAATIMVTQSDGLTKLASIYLCSFGNSLAYRLQRVSSDLED